MWKRGITVAALLGAVMVAGCQAEFLSDDRLAENTGGVLGIAPEKLIISGRHGDATNTYYTAQEVGTRAKWACMINGGGLLAAGLVVPPSCRPI